MKCFVHNINSRVVVNSWSIYCTDCSCKAVYPWSKIIVFLFYRCSYFTSLRCFLRTNYFSLSILWQFSSINNFEKQTCPHNITFPNTVSVNFENLIVWAAANFLSVTNYTVRYIIVTVSIEMIYLYGKSCLNKTTASAFYSDIT